MANRRNKIMDAPVNPALLPGLIMLADSLTISADAKDVTISFPAKWIWSVLATFTGTSITQTYSVTSDVATVVFTNSGTGVLNYLIIASVTETSTAATTAVDVSYTPIS